MSIETLKNAHASDAHDDEYRKAFSIAKEALGFIGAFRTAPTPDVYSVWYRYAEGSNIAIRDQLAHAVNVVKSVSREQLESLQRQFLENDELTSVQDQLSEEIASEIRELQSIIRSQLEAGHDFSNSIDSATDCLQAELVTPAEIKACIANLNCNSKRMKSQLEEMHRKLNASHEHVALLRENLRESQIELLSDPLTGVGNRREFDREIARSVLNANAHTKDYLLVVDLDDLKTINDSYGHSAGDLVIKFVASQLKRLANGAFVARYGGDEFAILLKLGERLEPLDFAQNICDRIAAHRMKVVETNAPLGKITISIGGARLRPGEDQHAWFDRADRLLYSAKHAGRNRVMIEREPR